MRFLGLPLLFLLLVSVATMVHAHPPTVSQPSTIGVTLPAPMVSSLLSSSGLAQTTQTVAEIHDWASATLEREHQLILARKALMQLLASRVNTLSLEDCQFLSVAINLIPAK